MTNTSLPLVVAVFECEYYDNTCHDKCCTLNKFSLSLNVLWSVFYIRYINCQFLLCNSILYDMKCFVLKNFKKDH